MTTETKDDIITGALVFLRRTPVGDIQITASGERQDPLVASLRDAYDEVFAECVQSYDWQEFLVFEPGTLAPEGTEMPDYYRIKEALLRPADTVEVRRVTHPYALTLENREGTLAFTETNNLIIVDISDFVGRAPARAGSLGTDDLPLGLTEILDGLGIDGAAGEAPAAVYKVWRVRTPAVEEIDNANFRKWLKIQLAIRVIAPTQTNDSDFYKRLISLSDNALSAAVSYDRRFVREAPYLEGERQYDYLSPSRRGLYDTGDSGTGF